MADSTNKPAFTLRDGRVKLTCCRHPESR